ncbi:hypothetical protein SZ64_00870 [Erythrobacter sp. SG61-1L]|uniref:RBBP9/YdeN family alpha/beta hydrolase n=1 Tax=Erythrobacter sp. SG61-1L TaxID=1603897 RepID=UPI0006D6E909|nr:alpha/beta hydrolase [Erythrobacter sp. SG61-1L]KPL66780.1 hypothetical protein SZ64_00870 [Erythrobacter sp. SG61-1L]
MTEVHNSNPDRPLVLIVPGLDNSGPGHWQTHWERERDDCSRVQLGMWDRPQPAIWADRLGAAIEAADRPVLLVAHSLGCHAVSWWNALRRPETGKVIGALLVAPPEVEDAPIDSRLAPFAPLSRGKLPFPSILVASGNDPYASFGKARRMARTWGSRLIDAGPLGHINAQSNIRDWPYGRFLLRRLLNNAAQAKVEEERRKVTERASDSVRRTSRPYVRCEPDGPARLSLR